MSGKQSTYSELEAAIEHLKDKTHVISDTSRKAKQEYDSFKASQATEVVRANQQNVRYMEEFNHNIDLLKLLFQKARMDDLLDVLVYPGRFFLMQLLTGLIRGMAFGLGLILIFAFSLWILVYSLPDSAIAAYLATLTSAV